MSNLSCNPQPCEAYAVLYCSQCLPFASNYIYQYVCVYVDQCCASRCKVIYRVAAGPSTTELKED